MKKLLKRFYKKIFKNNKETKIIVNPKVKIYEPSAISNTEIGDYTYIAPFSHISMTTIGKFCSIGPFIVCGWGIHPLNGISTNPMFYSIQKQNGFSLTEKNKCEERKKIYIGNDVFIGANVTILDGVHIGDGCVIGAGAVPAKIIRYRFNKDQINSLKKIKWWNWGEEKLIKIEEKFFDVEKFIKENL